MTDAIRKEMEEIFECSFCRDIDTEFAKKTSLILDPPPGKEQFVIDYIMEMIDEMELDDDSEYEDVEHLTDEYIRDDFKKYINNRREISFEQIVNVIEQQIEREKR